MADDDEREPGGEEAPVAGPRREPGSEPEPEGETGGLGIMPAFQFGGRVERTGIALVHEGEYLVPAPGSEAVTSPDGAGPTAQQVTYSFPIQVEVVGELSEDHVQALASHVFDELDTALRSKGRG